MMMGLAVPDVPAVAALQSQGGVTGFAVVSATVP
jgi:hypothetical protein